MYKRQAYDLIKGIDQMMGLRTQFVHLYVKDLTDSDTGAFVDYGLYTQVEQLNKTALKAHGLDSTGQLYKINSFEFHRNEDIIRLTTDPAYDQKMCIRDRFYLVTLLRLDAFTANLPYRVLGQQPIEMCIRDRPWPR